MIDNCKSWSQSWLNWTNKLSTFEEKAKPDYFSEKLNLTCRILQAGFGKLANTFIILKRKELTLPVFITMISSRLSRGVVGGWCNLKKLQKSKKKNSFVNDGQR